MAARSAIAWTRSTFNPWIGCTKVGPGCDHCYAEVQDSRKRWGGITHWGAGVPRHRTAASTWKQPLSWNRQAAKTGEFWPVFCASLADVFDNEVNPCWRSDLIGLMYDTPNLTWLLLTKRIGNVPRLMEECTEPDKPWRLPPNVWIGATIVNQEEWDRDRDKLLALPAAVRFVSYEPALGPIKWGSRMPDWIIVGGESGSEARGFYPDWARSTVARCIETNVPVFVKQMGSRVLVPNDAGFDGCDPGSWPLRPDGCDPELEFEPHGYVENHQGADCRIRLMDSAGEDPAEWPDYLRVREWPGGRTLSNQVPLSAPATR